MLRKLVVVVIASVVLPLSAPSLASAHNELWSGWGGFGCLSQKVVQVDGDIVDVAVSNPAFSTLVTALTAAGLVETLKGPGPFTVFAPTNAAFAGLPPVLLGAALSDPEGLLTSILTYHVAGGTYDPRYAFLPREIRSVQGQGLFLSASKRAAGVNQSNVNCQGIKASNGVIWVIDSVLLPQFPAAN
jgi:uncharacterized surface protein with fasciclin (FAS1) repeats